MLDKANYWQISVSIALLLQKLVPVICYQDVLEWQEYDNPNKVN